MKQVARKRKATRPIIRSVMRGYTPDAEESAGIPNGDILITGVSFNYGANAEIALHTTDCSIRQGEVTLLYGESGSGKSTLAKLLIGLYPLQQGTIRIGLLEYGEIPLTNIRSYYAYVPQSPYFFQDTWKETARTCPEGKSSGSRLPGRF